MGIEEEGGKRSGHLRRKGKKEVWDRLLLSQVSRMIRGGKKKGKRDDRLCFKAASVSPREGHREKKKEKDLSGEEKREERRGITDFSVLGGEENGACALPR